MKLPSAVRLVGSVALLSKDDFRFAFSTAMKDEAAALPKTYKPQHVVILFDEWNGHNESETIFTNEDKNFADFVMREFTIGKVIPVFLSHNEALANQLCYLNEGGTKIRPFPQCFDPRCAWECGDGKNENTKYLPTSAIEWKSPAWSTEDLLNIAAGQEVVLDVPSTPCSFENTKLVPMVPPENHGVLTGTSPLLAMQICRTATIAKATQLASGGRQQALLNVELPTMEHHRAPFQPPAQTRGSAIV